MDDGLIPIWASEKLKLLAEGLRRAQHGLENAQNSYRSASAAYNTQFRDEERRRMSSNPRKSIKR